MKHIKAYYEEESSPECHIMADDTTGTRVVHPSGAPEFIPGFSRSSSRKEDNLGLSASYCFQRKYIFLYIVNLSSLYPGS